MKLIRKRNNEDANCPDSLVFNSFVFSIINNDLLKNEYSYEKYKRNLERRLKVKLIFHLFLLGKYFD